MSFDFASVVHWLDGVRLCDHSAVERQARWLLLDTLACIVAGLAYPEPRKLAQRLERAMRGEVRWPGSSAMLSAPAAAAAGATAACWHEGCEGLARAHGRPGLHAVPVAAALGLANKASLGDVLTAIVWGYEIGARAGEAMRIRSGLHVDGMWGALASVAAAAKLLDVTDDRYLDALGIAACQISASLYEPVRAGKTARNTYAAHAALVGTLSAESAAAGIDAPSAAFEQAALQMGSGTKPAAGWPWCEPGEFLILQGYFKPYAGVRHAHYAVEAALQWRAQHGRDTRVIERIVLETYPEAITYCGVRAARSLIQAQFSLSYATAYALRTGGLGTDAYTAEALGDAEQQRLESVVELRADPEIAGRGARVRVRTSQGEQVYFADVVEGDAARPFDEQRIRQKALTYMRDQIGEAAASSIAERILHAPLSAPFSLGSEAHQ